MEASIAKFSGQTEDIPIIIGGKEYRTDNVLLRKLIKEQQTQREKLVKKTPRLNEFKSPIQR